MPSVKELEINSAVYDIKGKTVVDNNSGELSFWSGTKAQYNAIQNKDSKCLYSITDDTDVSLTILEALYPVGSVYITTANTCPLSTLISGSTWELVSSGRVLQGADSGHSAGTTIEAGLPNITGSAAGNRTPWSWDVCSGALYNLGDSTVESNSYKANYDTVTAGKSSTIGLDASRSSSIYGNSSTVQPPAYVVNIYRRTS